MVPGTAIEINTDIRFAGRKMIEEIVRSSPIDEVVLHPLDGLEERIDVVSSATKCLGHGPDQHDRCDGIADGRDRGHEFTSCNPVDKFGKRLWRIFHAVFIVGDASYTIVEQCTFSLD